MPILVTREGALPASKFAFRPRDFGIGASHRQKLFNMASSLCDNPLLSPPPESVAPVTPLVTAEKHTYGQILKSSALVGGSSVLNIAIGIIRTKLMAMLLGPAGFGLAGLYSSVADLTQSVAGMGINSSGVRQIAEAVGSDDAKRIALTTAVLRRTSIVLGVLGATLLVVFSRQVSTLTFGNDQHAAAVSLLSIAVFFRLVSAGQGALIQGMRRIADLAKMGVLGAFFGTLISIPVVYFFREKGVVPYLIAVAATTIITSWWYSRKLKIQTPPVTAAQVGHEAAALLKLGFAFMSSGLMTMGVAYAVRITVMRKLGVEATGLYQSAWTLGGLYVGLILQAMGADFYPRLTASAKKNAECNRLVNEQALVGLLLAGPGVIATLTFAPLVIALFYTAKFGAAVGILRWICLGATLQVITWPMGFIILAKGKSAVFFFSELAWTVVAVGLAWICVRLFGLNGAGIAFFGSYVFHGILIYPIVRQLSGFRWSKASKQTGLLFLSLIAVVFTSFYVLPLFVAASIGALATILSGVYSLRSLIRLTAIDPAVQRRFYQVRDRFNSAVRAFGWSQ
jgi:enterobacterial common antigen flippase